MQFASRRRIYTRKILIIEENLVEGVRRGGGLASRRGEIRKERGKIARLLIKGNRIK